MTTISTSATAPATDPFQRIYTLYRIESTAHTGAIHSYEQLRTWQEARKQTHHRPLEESIAGLEHLLQTSQEKRNVLALAGKTALTGQAHSQGVTLLLQLAAGSSVLFCLSFLLW